MTFILLLQVSMLLTLVVIARAGQADLSQACCLGWQGRAGPDWQMDPESSRKEQMGEGMASAQQLLSHHPGEGPGW